MIKLEFYKTGYGKKQFWGDVTLHMDTKLRFRSLMFKLIAQRAMNATDYEG